MNITSLPISETTTSGCGCGCGSNAQESAVESPASADVLVLNVEGLTCGGCASTVTRALTGLDRVTDANVELNSGGISKVTVYGAVSRDEATKAVEDAGYGIVK